MRWSFSIEHAAIQQLKDLCSFRSLHNKKKVFYAPEYISFVFDTQFSSCSSLVRLAWHPLAISVQAAGYTLILALGKTK